MEITRNEREPAHLRAVHDAALAAARRAGAAIRAVYRERHTVRDKGGGNLLTEADLASNRILEEDLRAAAPAAGWLSEESADDPSRLGRPACWIVDPLDGTREFTEGIPEFVVAVAYVVGDEARVGVLFNPVTGELFSGIVGEGAWLDGAPVHVTAHDALAAARVLCSRTESGKGWFDRWAGAAKLVPVGSVAYKLGLVAAGRAEATFTPRPRNAWDLAAGVAVLHAAGGRATDRHGGAYRFNQLSPLHDGVCATNGPLHEAVLGLMR